MINYQRQLKYPDRTIELAIVRQKRKTMAIHVFPGNKSVELRVPLRCAWVHIDEFIAEKHQWIYQSILHLANQPEALVPSFTPSALHDFLGERYALVLTQGRGKAYIESNYLHVRCNDPKNPTLVSKQLDHFYRNQSLPIFEDRLDLCISTFPVLIKPNSLRVRKMRARWGSCSQNGDICLNTLLIQKHIDAIDFVVNHELCHLIHFNHNKAFYGLLDKAMPNWRQYEKLLSVKYKPHQFSLF